MSHMTAGARNPLSNEQNSSPSNSTGSTDPRNRKCFRCGESFSRKHLQECRAQNVTCDGCGIKGHYKRCCKKTGIFPRDNSNRENQSSSTGNMRYAAAIPDADYFDERGIHKEYRPPMMQQQIGSMNVLRKVHNPGSVPTPDFPFTEFPSTEVDRPLALVSLEISTRRSCPGLLPPLVLLVVLF